MLILIAGTKNTPNQSDSSKNSKKCDVKTYQLYDTRDVWRCTEEAVAETIIFFWFEHFHWIFI